MRFFRASIVFLAVAATSSRHLVNAVKSARVEQLIEAFLNEDFGGFIAKAPRPPPSAKHNDFVLRDTLKVKVRDALETHKLAPIAERHFGTLRAILSKRSYFYRTLRTFLHRRHKSTLLYICTVLQTKQTAQNGPWTAATLRSYAIFVGCFYDRLLEAVHTLIATNANWPLLARRRILFAARWTPCVALGTASVASLLCSFLLRLPLPLAKMLIFGGWASGVGAILLWFSTPISEKKMYAGVLHVKAVSAFERKISHEEAFVEKYDYEKSFSFDAVHFASAKKASVPRRLPAKVAAAAATEDAVPHAKGQAAIRSGIRSFGGSNAVSHVNVALQLLVHVPEVRAAFAETRALLQGGCVPPVLHDFISVFWQQWTDGAAAPSECHTPADFFANLCSQLGACQLPNGFVSFFVEYVECLDRTIAAYTAANDNKQQSASSPPFSFQQLFAGVAHRTAVCSACGFAVSDTQRLLLHNVSPLQNASSPTPFHSLIEAYVSRGFATSFSHPRLDAQNGTLCSSSVLEQAASSIEESLYMLFVVGAATGGCTFPLDDVQLLSLQSPHRYELWAAVYVEDDVLGGGTGASRVTCVVKNNQNFYLFENERVTLFEVGAFGVDAAGLATYNANNVICLIYRRKAAP